MICNLILDFVVVVVIAKKEENAIMSQRSQELHTYYKVHFILSIKFKMMHSNNNNFYVSLPSRQNINKKKEVEFVLFIFFRGGNFTPNVIRNLFCA